MSVIYMLLTISIIVAIVFFLAFIYSVKRGQYDDSYTPSVRVLFEDELVIPKQKKSAKSNKSIQPEKSQNS
ncbi:MAG: cbb3-type cytochrome oxidase assembly protein CcoS [Flavobacteriaceae bacterium]